jgi:hypothetical protein
LACHFDRDPAESVLAYLYNAIEASAATHMFLHTVIFETAIATSSIRMYMNDHEIIR